MSKRRIKPSSESRSRGAEPKTNSDGNTEKSQEDVENIVDVLIHCNRILRSFSRTHRDDIDLLIGITRREKRPKIAISFVTTESSQDSEASALPTSQDSFVHDDSRCLCCKMPIGKSKELDESSGRQSIPLSQIPTAREITQGFGTGEQRLVAEIHSLKTSI
ncbi:hypothetical protein QR680_016641 [Steinernema hermaphroditum]|uniref:Uncharacterized protein n=1 Tax=Steinernema hermaphroditum TaxID=289476 RepID=A0AA39LMW6_9BILA|nr:hypothetical protein QR680_016641 [Steinernema hermaphroditum]